MVIYYVRPLLLASISLSNVTVSIHQFTRVVKHNTPQKDLIKNSTVEDFETQQEQLFIVGWSFNTVVGFYSTLKKATKLNCKSE